MVVFLFLFYFFFLSEVVTWYLGYRVVVVVALVWEENQG